VVDYFLEFAPDQTGTDHMVYFHREVLEHTHVNSQLAARRCLFIDRTDLVLGFYPRIKQLDMRHVAVSLSAAPLGRNIRYFDKTKVGAEGVFIVHDEDEDSRADLPARLYRNSTHLIEIIIPREPIDKVFKLAR
jgi:hypothetical protein